MKTQVKNYLPLLLIIFLCSCINKKAEENEITVDVNSGILVDLSASNEIVVDENADILETSSDIISENYNWLTKYGWSLSDGRHLADPSIDGTATNWIGKTPLVFFEMFNIPSDSILYQVRPNRDFLYFLYQTEEKDKLYPIGSAYCTEVFDLEFGDNYSYLSLRRYDLPYTQFFPIVQQLDPDYPLVGIWGKLPSLIEYRLANPENCVFYMDIDSDIPGYAVRRGTYLFYKTGDDTFETISSFPDGHMRLEIKDERLLILTPLYTLTEDEEGWVAPLIVDRIPFPKANLVKEEY